MWADVSMRLGICAQTLIRRHSILIREVLHSAPIICDTRGKPSNPMLVPRHICGTRMKAMKALQF